MTGFIKKFIEEIQVSGTTLRRKTHACPLQKLNISSMTLPLNIPSHLYF